MSHLDAMAVLSWGFFALTALLLIATIYVGQTLLGRWLAVAAIGSVCVADYAMIQTYSGEKELIYERPGPMVRRAIERRGQFEYVEEEGGSRSGAQGGSGHGAASGGSSGAGDSAGGEDAGSSSGGAAASAASGISDLLSQLMASASIADGNSKETEVFRDCADCPELVVVGPGYLRMGAAPDDRSALASEHPRRTIKVARRFAIGRSEVTAAQFEIFAMATGHPTSPCGAHMPARVGDAANCISVLDAQAYVAWLRGVTGRSYRLPTEAEWEYAARGGSDGPFASGALLERGPLNSFGLAGIHGGVAEMVVGCWSDTLKAVPGDASYPNRRGDCSRHVLRDAATDEPAVLARLSARRAMGLDEKRAYAGFRIVRDL